jgi:hypothetical protein
MNGFIILGTLHGYDVPLALFDERDAAEMFAEDVTADEAVAALIAAWKHSSRPLVQPLVPIGVVLCEFRDCEPQPFESIKSF